MEVSRSFPYIDRDDVFHGGKGRDPSTDLREEGSTDDFIRLKKCQQDPRIAGAKQSMWRGSINKPT